MSTVAAAKIQQQKLAQVLAQKAGKGGGVGGAAGTGTDGEPLVITGIDVPPGQTLQSYPWSDIQFPSNFTMTKEEQSLMDMYALVRNCEREAGRYREQQAKAKLAAADEEFHKKQEAIAKDDNNEEEDKKDDDDNDVDAEDDSDHEDDDVDETGVASKPKIKIKRANIKRKRPTANLSDDESSNGDNDDDDDDEDNVDSFMDQEYAESKKAKVSAKKKKSKQQLAADDEADKEEEDRQREALLGYGGDNHRNNDPLGVAASLLLKKKSSSAMAFGAGGKGAPAASLLASAVSASTPVHDFSKKLAFDNNRDGTILFPFKSTKVDEESNVQSWSPPQDARRPTDRCLQMDLPDFDSTLMTNKVGRPNNTLAIKFTAPRDSQRFSLNIMGPDSNPKAKELTDVLVHFNPRRRERGGRLVVNDKQEGMWGKAVMIPLKEMPTQMFGPRNGSITLVIQINAEGFDFFVEGKHCARLDHRTPLPTGQCSLHLQFPSTDDYGKPENWTVFRIWWGHKDTMAVDNHQELAEVAGFQKYNALHPRKLFVSALPKISTQQEMEIRRAELERAFRKYSGNLGAVVLAPKDSTFAFVEVESERQADLAIYEMQQSGRYRVLRARRTRYEALQEERASKEREQAKADAEWD